MSKTQFAVIGLGTFGSNLAKELVKRGFPVLAIDNKEEIVNKITPFVTQAIVADATDGKALENAGIKDCDTVVVAIGEDIETSILATLVVKDLGIKNVIVKCISQWHSKIAVKIGADRVIYPEFFHSRLVIRFYIALKLLCLLKQIHFLVERKIIYYGKTSAFECVHTYIIKRKG